MSKGKQGNHPPCRPPPALRGGFTLVEMLVVLGIIGLLAGALIGSFSHIKTTARQSQAQALAGEVATALTTYLQRYGQWPDDLLKGQNGASDPSKMEMDKKACWMLQDKKLLDVTVKVWSDSKQDWVWDTDAGGSLDRFGLLDPWGRDALRKNPAIASEDAMIGSGGKLSDHRIQYRLDVNYDGYVDETESQPLGVKVRASAIAWSRGTDGKTDDPKKKPFPKDDRYSFSIFGATADKSK